MAGGIGIRVVSDMGNLSETSDSLLERIKKGEQASWEKLVFVYSPLVSRWCKDSSIQDVDTDDLTQEIFQSVFRKIDTFIRVGPYSFRGWLKKVTLNQCIDFHRKSAKFPQQSRVIESITISNREIDESSFFDGSLSPEGINEEKNIVLKQVFSLIRNEFSKRDVEVFCDLVGHSIQVEAVADIHQISKNNVYKIKCRILARIKKEFDELVDFGSE